jgi:hypothetical protein
MKTYRVSNVERFRQWEEDEEGDTARLILDIVGGGHPTQAMLAGTAFHKVLELAEPGQEIERVEQDGFLFIVKADLVLPVTPIRELRAHKVYMVDGEPIGITGMVDVIEGLRVEDHKTTATFTPERYLEGYQWRLYLDIFEAMHFRWNVFEIKEIDEPPLIRCDDHFDAEGRQCALHKYHEGEHKFEADPFALGPFCYEVVSQHPLEQYRYPTMANDVQRLVERFARFVREYVEAGVPA